MRSIALPESWSAWRSAAALMCFSSYLSGGRQLARQLPLIYWELEKYGPYFCEPPAKQVVDEAMTYLQQQLEQTDALMPENIGRFHGSVVLQYRGREALNMSLAGCARVAAIEATTPAHDTMIFDAAVSSLGPVSINKGGVDYHLGPDEARELAESGRLPQPPTHDKVRADLAACVAILPRPQGWSPVHAIAFLLHAAHVVDRQVAEPLPEKGQRMLRQVRQLFELEDDVSLDTVVTQATQLLQRCGRSRFVLVRALEDQLMHLVQTPLDFRELVVQLVNHVAADETPSSLRRQIVTTTTAVLATSPAAMQRPRDCPEWPV